MSKLFYFGYGYVAEYLTRELRETNQKWTICGTTTDVHKMARMREDGVKAYLFSDESPLDDPLLMLEDVTHVLISIPPNKFGDPVFQTHARDILQIPTIQWIGYLSSTSVYGNRDGDWVDEMAELKPTSERGTKRQKAETQWLKLRRIAGIPINIFRLAGIYGPDRSALDSVRVGNSRRVFKEGHAFNRIHVEDIVQVLIASMNNPHPRGDIYNLADDDPAPSHELIAYACELLGRTIPPLVEFEDADLSPMGRSFYKDNKRIANQKIKDDLGVDLKYPNYKIGLESILKME